MGIIVIILVVLLSGCVVQPTYLAPSGAVVPISSEIKIDKSFDEVWQSLIEYSAKSFFSIKNFEKDSGLLTLAFGNSQPERYVDCGDLNAPHMNYDGAYLSAVQTTGRVALDGAMNLFVKSIGGNKTVISVNAKYVLSVKDGNLPMQTWSFDTAGSEDRKSVV